MHTLLWSAISPGEAGLKLIHFFLVHCLGTLEDVATTRISVAADTSQSLLESASIAKGTCHKQVDAIFLHALLSLLQAIVDAAHQRFIGHDEAVAMHFSDAGQVHTVRFGSLEAISLSKPCYQLIFSFLAKDELGSASCYLEELFDARHLAVDVAVDVLVTKLTPNFDI